MRKLLKFAIEDFLEDKKRSNLSDVTLNNYRLTLKAFKDFCLEREIINVEDISTQIIESFLENCQKKGNNVTSINTKLTHIQIFFSYLLENERIKKNPAKKVKKAKVEIKIEVFTEAHIKEMLSYYRKMKQRSKSLYAYRDHTLVILLLSTGMRIGEVANLKWNDIDLVNGSITVFGKARKQQGIPIVERLVQELSEFKIFCEREFEQLPEYVFVTMDGRSMSVNALKMVLKRLKVIMNFKDVRLSAHTFRHTFAYNFLKNGGDVFSLQRMLRHSQLRMTERYLSVWGNNLKEQNEKYNPLSGMDL